MSQIILASSRIVPEKTKGVGFKFKFEKVESALGDIFKFEKNGEREFFTRQFIPQNQNEVFKFFSNENNLERLTPPFLNFKVLKKSTPEIQNSTLIDYSLKIHGMPVKWKTEILNWKPPVSFIDQQLRGPYKKWHHTHSFESFAGGTLMTDRVIYKLPFGFIGQLAAGCMVEGDIKKIFNYRRQEIINVFG
jgi:ligand-binding SRPBCC domain-containing protein